MLIHADSLAQTVDAVNEAIVFGRPITKADALCTARFIASRQGLPQAYAGSFAPFDGELERGFHLFSGEHLPSGAARHVLGQECSRVLRQLDCDEPLIRHAWGRANAGLLKSLASPAAPCAQRNLGVSCCGACSVAMWRNALAGGLDRQAERLRGGLRFLRTRRDASNGWRSVPFWYAVLTLIEIDGPAARAELEYAAPRLQQAIRSQHGTPARYADRRSTIAARAFARLEHAPPRTA